MKTITEPNYSKSIDFEDNFSSNQPISSNEIDFWDTLPQFLRDAIIESHKQYKEGKFTKFSEVKTSILARKHRE
jgi:hypothetical protein